MIEQLNNPVWSALTSGNQALGIGNHLAKYFDPAVAPFAAVERHTQEHFEALMLLVPHNRTIAVFTPDRELLAAPWTIVNRVDGYQMMYEGETPELQTEVPVVPLEQHHVPAMLELTKLTQPGPFLEETVRFGGYEGIFQHDQLVAMAGRRFHNGPYVEISAVCTHPDHTGKGYARTLIQRQVRQLRGDGLSPYLHLRADNTRAYRLYKDLGFVLRTHMMIYILQK